MQQGVQTDATCNIQQCWELLANNVASVCTGFKLKILFFAVLLAVAVVDGFVVIQKINSACRKI